MISRFIENLKGDDMLKPLQLESSIGNRVVVETAFEISQSSKLRLQTELDHQQLGQAEFEMDSGLVCGIELNVGGHKIGWSVQEYLVLLADEFSGLISQEA